MKITYYLEVLSSWCFWCEPTWAELQRRYAARVEFDWQIARMQPGDWPTSRAQLEWFYRRSAAIMGSPTALNPDWFEPLASGVYPAASAVAVAARGLGERGDIIRLALSHAAEREGRNVAELDLAVEVAVTASAGRLDAAALRRAAQSDAVAAQLDASTQVFLAHQLTQRPAFVLGNTIGDKAVFSGLVRIEPLAAALDAMLADEAAYVAYRAQHGPAPSA
jgi:predicted DsbA family dithiol-disulfide isomerase